MNRKWKQELAVFVFLIVPFIVLYFAWNDIQDELIITASALNYKINIKEPKSILIFLCLIPLIVDLILVVIIYTIHPNQAGDLNKIRKYMNLKLMIIVFLVLLDFLILWNLAKWTTV